VLGLPAAFTGVGLYAIVHQISIIKPDRVSCLQPEIASEADERGYVVPILRLSLRVGRHDTAHFHSARNQGAADRRDRATTETIEVQDWLNKVGQSRRLPLLGRSARGTPRPTGPS
jgi:hypothetical protein